MIKDLSYDPANSILEWSCNDLIIKKEISNVISFISDSENKFVFVIYQPNIDNTRSLLIFQPDGKVVFEILPPKDHVFCYLTRHFNNTTSVVCEGDRNSFGWSQFHFIINTKNGKLKLLGPAY